MNVIGCKSVPSLSKKIFVTFKYLLGEVRWRSISRTWKRQMTLKQILFKSMNSADFDESICLTIKERFCSNQDLNLVFDICLKFLSQKSASKRLRCLTIISELSDIEYFRLLIIESLDEIVSLIFEPFACSQGKLLKQKALVTLKKWHELYSSTPQIIIAFARLEKLHDFSHEAIFFPAQPDRVVHAINPREVKKNQEIARITPKVHEVIQEMNNCFDLLERENLSKTLSSVESFENRS